MINILYIQSFFIFLFGIVLGSYFHATAYRYTKSSLDDFYNEHEKNNYSYFRTLKEELKRYFQTFKPVRSHCPVCNYQLKWFENIPVFSFIFLKGKCSNCKTKIPFIYFIAELFLGILFISIFFKFYFIDNKDFYYIFSFLIFISFLYLISLIDLKSYFIPDIFFFFILPFALFIYIKDNTIIYFLYSFIFTIISYFVLLFIYLKFNKVFIGFGDIKLVMFLYPFMHDLKSFDVFILLFSLISLINYLYLSLIGNFKKSIPAGFNIFLAFSIYILFKNQLYNILF